MDLIPASGPVADFHCECLKNPSLRKCIKCDRIFCDWCESSVENKKSRLSWCMKCRNKKTCDSWNCEKLATRESYEFKYYCESYVRHLNKTKMVSIKKICENGFPKENQSTLN